MGNESETLKLKIRTAEVEAEITGPENLPPGTVKELAQETEGWVTIFGTDYITLAWCITIEHSKYNAAVCGKSGNSPLTTRDLPDFHSIQNLRMNFERK